MNSRWWKIFWGSLLAVAAFYVLRHVILIILVEGRRFDLDIIITAAKRFMAYEPVYRFEDGFPHTKPPLLMGIAFILAWIPHFWVRLFWDLVVFTMPWLILREYTWRWRPLTLTFALMYPFWYKEAEYGQYNLFNFWFILLAARWACSEKRWPQLLAGACAALTVVIKPTQIYLIPWVLLLSAGMPDFLMRTVRVGLGAVILGVTLAGSYIFLRSPHELITDHLEWARFLPKATLEHLMGANNYGLPTLFARLGWTDLASRAAFVPVTLLFTGLIAWKFRTRRELSLHLSALLMMAFSPMAWRANFGIFAGIVYGLAIYVEKNGRETLAWIGLAAMLFFAKASEYWIGVTVAHWFGVIAAPLWIVLLASICLEVLRRREEQVLG